MVSVKNKKKKNNDKEKCLPTYPLRIRKRRNLVGLKFIFIMKNDSIMSKTGIAKIYIAQT